MSACCKEDMGKGEWAGGQARKTGRRARRQEVKWAMSASNQDMLHLDRSINAECHLHVAGGTTGAQVGIHGGTTGA
jgi:hypothetical protein